MQWRLRPRGRDVAKCGSEGDACAHDMLVHLLAAREAENHGVVPEDVFATPFIARMKLTREEK